MIYSSTPAFLHPNSLPTQTAVPDCDILLVILCSTVVEPCEAICKNRLALLNFINGGYRMTQSYCARCAAPVTVHNLVYQCARCGFNNANLLGVMHALATASPTKDRCPSCRATVPPRDVGATVNCWHCGLPIPPITGAGGSVRQQPSPRQTYQPAPQQAYQAATSSSLVLRIRLIFFVVCFIIIIFVIWFFFIA